MVTKLVKLSDEPITSLNLEKENIYHWPKLTCLKNRRVEKNNSRLRFFQYQHKWKDKHDRFQRHLSPKWMQYTEVLYMFSSFWLLGIESHDFSRAERQRTACKAEQIHKTTTISTQNGRRLSFWVKIVVILWICSALQAVLCFSAWEKSRESFHNSNKLPQI